MMSFRGIVCGWLALAGLCWSRPAWPQSTEARGPGSFLPIEGSKIYFPDLLSAHPHDMTHAYFEFPVKPALLRLHEIQIPTLLLVGDADIPDVHAHAGAIEAGIPRARRVVIKDVGHLMYLEKPAQFSRLVIRFIEQNESGE
jgi:pimeloyl-ACP methyl ester carboxylesterase